MKYLFIVIMLFVGGCSSTAVAPTAPSKKDDVSSYAQKGSASIHGQAFLKTKDGAVKSAAGNDVVLIPAILHTDETVGFLDVGTHAIAKISPNLRSYSRITHANGSGYFEFSELPAGDYYLECGIYWQAGDSRTGAVVRKKISLSKNQTLKVVLSE